MSSVSVDFEVETIEPHPESKKFKEDNNTAEVKEDGSEEDNSDEEEIEGDDIPEDIDSDSIEWV